MGGIESTTLGTVKNLSEALTSLEEKLTTIESVHVENQVETVFDSAIHVSGVCIPCNPEVDLLVGPVVGTITTTSIRFLLETNCNTVLRQHIFSLEESCLDPVFVSSQELSLFKHEPKVFKIENLTPATRYIIYFGGVKVTTCLKSFIDVYTLPISPSRQTYLCTSNLVVNIVNNSELSNIIRSLQFRVSKENKNHLKLLPEVHMIFHLGNFLSIEKSLETLATNAVRTILASEPTQEMLISLLEEIENRIKEIYRDALMANSSVQEILRSAGNIFLCGSEEAGYLAKTSLLKYLTGQTYNEFKGITEMGGLSETIYDAVTAKRNESAISNEDHKNVAYLALSLVYRCARRVQYTYMRQLWDESAVTFLDRDRKEETLHLELLVYSRRMLSVKTVQKQLESTFKQLEESSAKRHPGVARIKRELLAVEEDLVKIQNSIRTTYEQLSLQSERETSSMSTLSIINVNTHGKITGSTLVIVDSKWQELLNKSNFLIENQHSTNVIDFSENTVNLLNNTFSNEIQNSQSLVDTINNSDKIIHNDENNERKGASGRKEIKGQEDECTENVVILSADSLLSICCDGDYIHGNIFEKHIHSALSGNRINAAGTLSYKSRYQLFKSLLQWKDGTIGRSCLLISPSTNCGNSISSSCGSSESINIGLNYFDLLEDNNNLDSMPTSKFEILTVGSMNSRGAQLSARNFTRHTISNLTKWLLQNSDGNVNATKNAIIHEWQSIGFVGHVTSLSNEKHDKNVGYVEFSRVRLNQGIEQSYNFTQHLAKDVSSLPYVGPVIGQVGFTKLTVLLDFNIPQQPNSLPCSTTLHLIDQVTGEEWLCRQEVQSSQPVLFTFNTLSPNRPFQIVVCDDNGLSCCIGSVTTKSTSLASEPLSIQIDGKDTSAVVEMTNLTPSSESFNIHAFANNLVDEVVRVVLKEVIVKQLDHTVYPAVNQLTDQTSSAEIVKSSQEIKPSTTMKSLPCERLLILGQNSPAQLFDQNNYPGIVGFGGNRLKEGEELLSRLVRIMEMPWGSFTHCLHCGDGLDVRFSIFEALSTIELKKFDSRQTSDLKHEVHEKIKKALKAHWGNYTSSSFPRILSSTSNIFVNSPSSIVANGLLVSSLHELVDTLKSDSLQLITESVEKVKQEYMNTLWPPSQTHPQPQNSSIYMVNDTVWVVSLVPRVVGLRCVVSGEFQTFRELDESHALTSLVVTLPVSMTLEAGLNDESGLGLGFDESLVLMERITEWLLRFVKKRNAILVCPGHHSSVYNINVRSKENGSEMCCFSVLFVAPIFSRESVSMANIRSLTKDTKDSWSFYGMKNNNVEYFVSRSPPHHPGHTDAPQVAVINVYGSSQDSNRRSVIEAKLYSLQNIAELEKSTLNFISNFPNEVQSVYKTTTQKYQQICTDPTSIATSDIHIVDKAICSACNLFEKSLIDIHGQYVSGNLFSSSSNRKNIGNESAKPFKTFMSIVDMFIGVFPTRIVAYMPKPTLLITRLFWIYYMENDSELKDVRQALLLDKSRKLSVSANLEELLLLSLRNDFGSFKKFVVALIRYTSIFQQTANANGLALPQMPRA